MGSLKLDCPLCCSETFSCHNSLKYHLLSITDNLICPACGQRFEKIFDLAMHLGNDCPDAERGSVNILNKTKAIEITVKNKNKEQYVSKVQANVPLIAEIKQEQSNDNYDSNEFDTGVTNSILAKALMKTPADNPAQSSDVSDITESLSDSLVDKENEQTPEDELYYCSSCAIKFTSIEDHLEKFHEGHEVFFEEEKEESESNMLDVNNLCVIRDFGEDDDDCDNDSVEINETIKSAELLNTIQEEECVDKDGRLYTRKVVKIEKFWDDKDTGNTSSQTNSTITLKDASSQETVLIENMQLAESNSQTTQTISEIYKCSKCGIKFSTMDNYCRHKCSGSRLDTTKYKKCKICRACFVNSKFLAVHMRTHKSKRYPHSPDVDPNPPFICEICNTEFPAYKSLRLHRRMHEPIKSKDIEPPVSYGMQGEELNAENAPREMFICQICNKTYDKEYEEAHKKFHSKEIDFNCEICNRKFYTQENLEMHMRAHSDTKKFACSYCKKGFLTKEKLEAHMSSKCQKRQYECQYCGRRFARPHEKVKHERIHTGEKPHVCEICGKAFRVSYCLTLHMRTHSGTRPYKCQHCGKRFKAHSVYNHHLLTHSEDRKYKCPFCPKTFKTGVQLAGHKNSHTKPFTCTECNRPFASLYAVRAHMETHQRQNNLKYRCWLCGASYARAFALRDHINEQHFGEKEPSVDEVDEQEVNVVDQENNTGQGRNMAIETIILNTDYPINENVESGTAILADGDESVLIDIESETVGNIEMSGVQVTSGLQDNDT